VLQKLSQRLAEVAHVCWEPCPSGYTDTGMLCQANTYYKGGCCCTIFGCCGCDSGYTDMGCFCQTSGASTRTKSSYVNPPSPLGCSSDEEYDAGLCYSKCRDGYHGIGPLCWRDCPPGFTDIGVSCELPDSCPRALSVTATETAKSKKVEEPWKLKAVKSLHDAKWYHEHENPQVRSFADRHITGHPFAHPGFRPGYTIDHAGHKEEL